jgi:hypothetical protein
MLVTFDLLGLYRICQWPQSRLSVSLPGKPLTIYSRTASSQTDNQCTGLTFRQTVLRVLLDIFRAVGKGGVEVLTLVDLSAVFDTVDHCLLQPRL